MSEDTPVKGNESQETQKQREVHVEDVTVTPTYSNFCRVASTPEELILDMGLNPHPHGAEDINIEIQQRIVMSHFTAKRLLSALSMALQRHEQAFGTVELDVRKRVVNQEAK